MGWIFAGKRPERARETPSAHPNDLKPVRRKAADYNYHSHGSLRIQYGIAKASSSGIENVDAVRPESLTG